MRYNIKLCLPLINKNNFMRISIAIVLSTLFIGLSSCKKDPKSVTYTIKEVDNSGVSALITGTEKGEKTQISIAIFNATDGEHYEVHFHEGPPASYIGFAPYTFHHIQANGNKALHTEDIDLKYENFVSLDVTCVVHPMGNADVLARAGIGKNAE
jgi:hypothetical protein